LEYTITQDIDGIRKILRTYQIPYEELYDYFFENLPSHDMVKSPGNAIIEIAEAAYRHSFMASPEINLIGMIMKLYQKEIV